MIATEKLMENKSDRDFDNNNKNAKPEIIYFAVHVPDERSTTLKANHVYTEKSEALRAVKENQGSRFKVFKKRSDAEQFALHGNDHSVSQSPGQPGLIAEEKVNNFKAPKSFVAFRKLLESGEIEEIRRVVWENPRLLISSCDTPTIVQEGCRYNALHIVASKSPEPAKLTEFILNTITDRNFLKLFYGDQLNETYHHYSELLVDRYINTPDKSLNETPLHFASKFGLRDMVKILVSYPQCLKTLRNKHGSNPVELICSRKNQSDKLKEDINILLQEQFYVPVLRSIDNTLQPIIGEPFSPTNPPKLNVDPMSPPVEVRAFAGPMTKEKAAEFRKKWKTPPRRQSLFSPGRDNHIASPIRNITSPIMNLTPRMQDPVKGLESVGRDLAEECEVDWKEHWDFLGGFVNLRSEEGLFKLEAYLKSKMYCPPIYCKGDQNETTENDVKNSTLDEINNLCDKFQATKLCDEDSDDDDVSESEFVTPPTSPLISSDSSSDEDDMCMAEEGTTTFIEGDQATKLDSAVYDAIPQEIDPYMYPYIYYWRHSMQILIEQSYRFIGKTPARIRIPATPNRSYKQFELKPMKINFSME